jgi:hypothetical protein
MLSYLGLMDNGIIIHHIVTLIALIIDLQTGYGSKILFRTIFIGDITVIPMNIRGISKSLGLRYTKIF